MTERTVRIARKAGEQVVHLSAPLQLAVGDGRREFAVRFVRAGQIVCADGTPGDLFVPSAAIETAVDQGMFDGLACFVDHPGWLDDNHSLRNLAAVSTDSHYNAADQSADGTVRLYDSEAGRIVGDLFAGVLEDMAAGNPVPDVGLSLTFYPQWATWDDAEAPGNAPAANAPAGPRVLTAFRKILSADFVFTPAADGRVKEALEALSGVGRVERKPIPPYDEGGDLPDASRFTSHASQITNQEDPMPPETESREQAAESTLSSVERAELPAEAGAQHWLRSLAQSASETIINASGLPAPLQAQLRAQSYGTPEEVHAAIDAQRQLLADLEQDNVVQVGNVPPRGGAASLGRTGMEQLTAALDALVAGVQPPAGVQPLTGLRELYHLLSGDYEMHGLYQPDRIYLANVNSSTMAGLVANAMNKRVMNLFQTYPQWWAPAVTIEDFSTLQDVRWITLGGVGELPTVAEGATYTELTWDDQTETDSFVKKGGYLGLTLEAIDKDDTTRLRAAPRALAQSAWLTLGKSIAEIFTTASDLGPTMADTGTLFNATAITTAGGHANLRATALSATEFNNVKLAMMKQAELNSGERLGILTRPYLLWVPIDLESTALTILASDQVPGGSNNDVNVEATGNDRELRLANARKRVVVCPLWTDTNNWAAQADPQLYPSIGLGFRYGRTPEIFSVASPTAGLMFTNDTLPVKVRFIFAVGPIDWRGLHKNNVA